MPFTQKKKPQRRGSMSSLLSRFSRRKIIPMENNRENEYRERAIIKHPKTKSKSRSPEPTTAKWLDTVGNYDSSDLNSIVPMASSVNLKYDFNYELPEATEYIIKPEYEKKPTMIEKMRSLIGRPKTHPQHSRVYILVNKRGGKNRRIKTPKNRGGGTCSSRQ